MNSKKECKIIGYGGYADKETGELRFRICMCVDGTNEKYNGQVAVFVFLPQTDELESKLKRALSNPNTKHYYTTEENIATGKTKVKEIYVD